MAPSELRPVRLKSDPGRIGVPTGRVRQRGGRDLIQVLFPDGMQYVPADNLEAFTAAAQDPLQQLREGRLGRAVDLRRALTHVRLTGRLADIIYSMDTTGTDFYAYQFKPVLRLLNSATSGILVADEVGLGKTIEAGLIWTELRIRFDFRRLVVLCPAMLREKWQRELSRRFGVKAEIGGSREVLARLQRSADEGPLDSFAMIGSLQGLRPRRGWEAADEDEQDDSPSSQLARFLERRRYEEPLVDVLVIDEAHYLRNPETMTSKLGGLFRTVAEYVLLLSATPIHLKSRDLFELAQLVDPDTFDHLRTFDQILEANRPLVALRDLVATGRGSREAFLDLVSEARAHPLLSGSRQLEGLARQPPGDEDLAQPRAVSDLCARIDRVNLLGHVVTRTRKRDVTEWRVVRDPIAEEVPLSEPEHQFYETVTQAVREYCERVAAHEGFLLVTPQRQMSSSMPAALRFWQGGAQVADQEIYEDLGIEGSSAEDRPLVRELVSRVHEFADLDTLWQNDSKYQRLVGRLRWFFEQHPREKVVLFSYFRATLAYLEERLEADGFPCVVLRGGMDDKDDVVDSFREMAGPAILLSSEVGSEGIDLQFCWLIINYDLPWNPMRVEQRIGRLDRLGQESPKVAIWNLFYDDTIDSRIYNRLVARLGLFEHALGSLEPILGDRIRTLAIDLLSQRLTPGQEEARIEQTALALENAAQHEEKLESEASQLVAYGDYILNQVRAARELSRRIDGEDLRSYVIDFFTMNYQGCQFLQDPKDDLAFRVSLSNEASHELEQFIRAERLETATRLVVGPSLQVACRFENSAVSASRRRVELISQFHPLVRFVSSRIRELESSPHPAVAVALGTEDCPADLRPGVYVFAIQRWSIGGLQDREKLYITARLLAEPERSLPAELAEQLVVAAAARGKDWLGAPEHVELERAEEIANETCLLEGDRAFDSYVEEIRAENEDRAGIQIRALDKHFTNQMTSLDEIRDRHVGRGRMALAKATEGRMRALEGRVEKRRYELERRRQTTHRKDEISVGLIKVGS